MPSIENVALLGNPVANVLNASSMSLGAYGEEGDIPAFIYDHLSALTSLDISNNSLRKVGDRINELARLKTLILSNNN